MAWAFLQFLQISSLALSSLLLFFFLAAAIFQFWVLPFLAYRRLRNRGFSGPPPSFPLGNIGEMSKRVRKAHHLGDAAGPLQISHDIHSTVFPYFAQWRQSYGKVFVYWLGTEPFVYIGEPEFLKQAAAGVVSKTWGKPTVFKRDRKPMFGKGLVMVEGDDWVLHRHIIAPAFSPGNLKAMVNMMVETTTKMLDGWSGLVNSGVREIDVERDVTSNAAEIIARSSFGMGHQSGQLVFEKLKAMQLMLFSSNRFVGVPFSNLMCLNQTLDACRLGKEIDHLLMSIIASRQQQQQEEEEHCQEDRGPQQDLLGILLDKSRKDGRKLSTRELVDECKTFFFGGHETTALWVSWTLLLLAQHPEWQTLLREEIMQVTQGQPLDYTVLSKLEKMGWVMNEVLRLYSPAPNVQRQAREEIQVGEVVIPKGTNMWIDVVGMHHDEALWGPDVNEFRPERFRDGAAGGCRHRMGFLPFGFGGRMCVGRNLSAMEYKIVLSLVLSRFSLAISPHYSHSPVVMLSLRPSHGIFLILESIYTA
ncbi:hypothetical protein ACLOJK_024409 [Asimina triloba]